MVFPADWTTILIVPHSGSEFSIVIGIRSPCSYSEDYELAGLLLARDTGRLNDKALNIRSKECSVNNLEHL